MGVSTQCVDSSFIEGRMVSFADTHEDEQSGCLGIKLALTYLTFDIFDLND